MKSIIVPTCDAIHELTGKVGLVHFIKLYFTNYLCTQVREKCQVRAWQSAILLPISCKSVQPVPARVEEPVSLIRQSSSGGVTNNPPFPKMP